MKKSLNKINGAIDYIVLKKGKKYIIFFLDNHNPSNYCKTISRNIESLFEDFMQINSVFILEEIIGYNEKFINAFNDTNHLNKYLKFYNKYKADKKIIPVDIRLLFDNFDEVDKFSNLDQFFNICECSNSDIAKIKGIIDKCTSISSTYQEHFDNLKDKYIKIKNRIINEKITNLKCNNYNIDYIQLNYPFVDLKEDICSQIDVFTCALLELYGIAQIELSNAKYNIVYLGAFHCVSMFYLLEKNYGYRKVKGLAKSRLSNEKYDLLSYDRFNLKSLDIFSNSCFDFIKY
jgi:hypothetical protein